MQLLGGATPKVCVSAEALLAKYIDERYRVSTYFAADNLLSSATVPFNSANVEIELFHCELAESDNRIVNLPATPAFLMLLYLEDTHHCDIIDGVNGPVRTFAEGSICLVNIASGASICLHSALKTISFLLPHDVMREIGARVHLSENPAFLCPRGEPDLVMHHIGRAFIDLVTPGTHQETMLLKHLVAAIGVHLLAQYGISTSKI